MEQPSPKNADWDLLIVGAGAAGLATAIFAARRLPQWRIAAVDGAARLGAKILVAGGGRCNVTNAAVRPSDYNTSGSALLKRILAAFTSEQTVAFFREIGVPLHAEEHGKLFPDSNSARTVVDALLAEAHRLNISLITGCRATGIAARPGSPRFEIATSLQMFHAERVVLATGGLSLPKTGSDGGGYALARALGHSLVPTTPALDPILLDGDFHAPLSGIAHPAEVTVHVEDERPVRRRGSLLWTHFGISGPVALDISRFWNRAAIERRPARATLSFLPGDDFAAAEARLLDAAVRQPRSTLRSVLASWLPERVAGAVLARAGIDGRVAMSQLPRETRRSLLHALLEHPLPITGTRGYRHAEVTAGGVPLGEVDAGLQSRCCPGLYLVGEILDVDGRIGGFNFQWAWSGAWTLAGSL